MQVNLPSARSFEFEAAPSLKLKTYTNTLLTLADEMEGKENGGGAVNWGNLDFNYSYFFLSSPPLLPIINYMENKSNGTVEYVLEALEKEEIWLSLIHLQSL